MSVPLTSVQWLVRAEDARLDAAAMNDPQAKRMMLVMAAGYERLAAHAKWLERSGLPHEGARTDFQLRGLRAHPAVGRPLTTGSCPGEGCRPWPTGVPGLFRGC